MDDAPADRTHRLRILVAIAGLVVLGCMWSRMGSGDSQPNAVAELPVSFSGAHAPLVQNRTPATPPRGTLDASALGTAEPPSLALPGRSEALEATMAISPDAELKAQFIGVWFHGGNGEQWIENRPDGTSRMLLKLDFISSLLYGEETTMELTWDLKAGVLTHSVVNGTPQINVDSLMKAFGKTREYTILETTPERILLESRDEKKKELWTRTPPPPEWKTGVVCQAVRIKR